MGSVETKTEAVSVFSNSSFSSLLFHRVLALALCFQGKIRKQLLLSYRK
jgi:hypothetical protein